MGGKVSSSVWCWGVRRWFVGDKIPVSLSLTHHHSLSQGSSMHCSRWKRKGMTFIILPRPTWDMIRPGLNRFLTGVMMNSVDQ